jgi:hypothetical protein
MADAIGLCSATILALAVLVIGALLVYHGAPIVGVALLVTAIGGLIGTAVYGHASTATTQTEPPEESRQIAAKEKSDVIPNNKQSGESEAGSA